MIISLNVTSERIICLLRKAVLWQLKIPGINTSLNFCAFSSYPLTSFWYSSVSTGLQCSHTTISSLGSTDLHPIHVLRFFVKADRPPIFEWTTVLLRVCSPSVRKKRVGNEVITIVCLLTQKISATRTPNGREPCQDYKGQGSGRLMCCMTKMIVPLVQILFWKNLSTACIWCVLCAVLNFVCIWGIFRLTLTTR